MDNAIPSSAASPLDVVVRKVTWRILPFLFVCYFFAYLDRVNVGFAKLQMQTDLGLSDAVYGLGAGIFIVGYFIFEVPSNLILYRKGARIWIARIMITWGLISVAMAFVTTPASFYLMRFLLGVAEAGFFPGIVLYLSHWFPAKRRGRITASFMAAIPLSGVVGGPVSGWVLEALRQTNGFAGWQWLFIVEGVPTVSLGVCVLFRLDDTLTSAKWLSEDEKSVLSVALPREQPAHNAHDLRSALRDGRVWTLSLIYFCIQMGVYAIGFWLPTLINAQGAHSDKSVGWLSALPYVAAALTMLCVARSADITGKRRLHLIGPMLLGCIGPSLRNTRRPMEDGRRRLRVKIGAARLVS